MSDQEIAGPNDPRLRALTAEAPHAARATGPSADLAAALDGLDQATRDFTRRFGGAGSRGAEAAPAWQPAAGEGGAGRNGFDAGLGNGAPDDALQARMREAEQEARAYLGRAKLRADSLVRTMVAAVEHEAAEIRRGAEESIRARWEQAEADAGRHVEAARLVAQGMVAERQERLATLSDGITGRARALTAGMDDAEQVRGQFDGFIRALSDAARRIADEESPSATVGELRDLRRSPRPNPIAA